ncbi:MAG: type I methionyl aminopeptidase [Fusobacteria bacterium]|nr:type I methionyl aminopeptidase [Fusobacteriota bacterium]
MITIKNEDSINKMKKAGYIVAKVLVSLKEMIEPGISLKELDSFAEKMIRQMGAVPSFKGYGGFPGSICASVNEEVIHGIPGKRRLKEGEIISIDAGAFIDGFHGDSAFTAAVGKISEDKQRLIDITEASFYEGLKMAKAGNHLGDISHSIEKKVLAAGFSVVKEFVGHGIGRELHEDPAVPNYGPPGRGVKLQSGMTLAIEPMVNMGTESILILDDGWTVVTKDKQPSAHYEHTILITDEEPVILTKGDWFD